MEQLARSGPPAEQLKIGDQRSDTLKPHRESLTAEELCGVYAIVE